MRLIFLAAKLGMISAATFCLLCAGVACLEISASVRQATGAVQLVALDADTSSQALNARLEKFDALAAKAGRDLDSLDSAIKTHQSATKRASDEMHGSFQNLNAVLIQAGLTSDEVRLASMSQRQALTEQNADLTAALKEMRGVLADTRKAVSDPAIHETLENVNATSTDVRQAVNELTHPPKSTRGQRALRFFLSVILGNTIQGAVRR